jgi:membrane protease YdiL (CAAX protease family)
MKQFVKKYWKTLLFFAVAGLVGGFCTGLYVLDSYPPEMQQEALAQGLTPTIMALVTAIQAAGYGIVLGIIGILLGKKTGLWKDETHFAKKPLLVTLAIALIGGLALILPDLLFFGKYNEAIMNSYVAKPTVVYIVGAILYGGVIEEVMLRLFFMTVIAFILWKLFARKEEKPTLAILVVSNIIAALLFAAVHLPATFMMIGSSPLILFRCFLLNGGFGLLFGYLYRKHGLRYSMLAHGGCHIVSKLIWILFI